MSKETNKNDDLDLNLEEVLAPIVEKAVEKAMPTKEEKAPKVERKEISINPDAQIRVKDPIVDADWKSADGIKAYLGGLTQAHFQKNLERKEAFYKRADIKDSSVYTKADNPMSTTNAAGGFTVPTELLADEFFVSIIDRPRLQDVLRNITVDSTGGAIPCIDANTTAAIVAENADTTDQKPTFDERAFSLDKAVALSYMSQELLAGTAIDMIGEVTANQIIALRTLIENEVTDGSNFTGTVDGTAWKKPTTSGALTYAHLKACYHTLAIEYRSLPTMWMMHPNRFEDIMSLTAGSAPLYDRNYGFAPEDTRVFGAPVFLNSQAVDTSIWYGAWDRAMAVFRHNSGLRIDTSEIGGTAWESVQYGIRAYELVDSNFLTNETIDSSFGGAVVEIDGIT
jgi:HK97 family phage major capsid protein